MKTKKSVAAVKVTLTPDLNVRLLRIARHQEWSLAKLMRKFAELEVPKWEERLDRQAAAGAK